MNKESSFIPEEEIEKVTAGETHDEKRGRYEIFLGERSMQREVVADFALSLIGMVERDSGVKLSTLYRRIDDFSAQNHASPAQIDALQKAVGLYAERRDEIARVVKAFPDSKDMFRHFFGFYPQGKFAVGVGALNIHFEFYDQRDFSRIPNSIRETADGSTTMIDGRFYGGNNETRHNVRSRGVVTIEFKKHSYQSGTKQHERMHALNSIVLGALEDVTPKPSTVIGAESLAKAITGGSGGGEILDKTEETKGKTGLLRRNLWGLIFLYDRRIKDELIAKIAGGGLTEDIVHSMTEIESYNYFKDYLERLRNSLNSYPKDAALADRVIREVFGEEYKAYLRQALGSVLYLIYDRRLGEKRAFLYLASSPVKSWEGESRRYRGTNPHSV